MRISTLVLLSNILSFGLVYSQTPPNSPPSLPPPAGRALLSRGAELEPFDFPPSHQHTFDPSLHLPTTTPILGPPSFWTEPSLHSHYHSTLHLRYHPRLYPVPPPFSVWLKEQKLIRAINILSSTIEVDRYRPGATQAELLEEEMHLAELNILLRLVQIKTTLDYANIAPEWRKWEESMYRHWAGFLEVSQRERGTPGWIEKHLEWLQGLVEEARVEERVERERLDESTKGMVTGLRHAEGGKGENLIPEGSAVPRRALGKAVWPVVGSSEEEGEGSQGMLKAAGDGSEKMIEEMRLAVEKGFHL